MDIIKIYSELCRENNIPFSVNNSVSPYDTTTLFCPAGMQQFKSNFIDTNYYGTRANIQSCIRLNDFNEIGDGTHLAYFNMIGLFSFRDMSVEMAIDFFVEFMKRIGIKIDHATVHQDKKEWDNFYKKHKIKVKIDNECLWSDGNIGGYCTEFYHKGIEIGNIVNPLGTCIDVGFGYERLDSIVNGIIKNNKIDLLKECALKIIEAGYKPSNTKQGYVLRKILRELYKSNNDFDIPFFKEEINRQNKILLKYNRLKENNKDKDRDWWYQTHGIDIEDLIK
jgi:alanyl-tRNA synthetase